MKKQTKIIISIVFLFVIALIIFLAFFYKGEISIALRVPATIKINGKEFKNITSFSKKLSPNNYELIASKAGYKEYKQKVRVEAFKKISIDINLEPKAEEVMSGVSDAYFLNGSVYYYSNQTLNKLDLKNKKTTTISDTLPFSVKKVFWSKNTKKALLFSNEARPQTAIFNSGTKEVKILDGEYAPTGDWSEDGQTVLIGSFQLEGFFSLNILNGNDLQKKEVSPRVLPFDLLKWAEKQNLGLLSSYGMDEGCLFQILDLNNGGTAIFNSGDCVTGAVFTKNSVLYEIRDFEGKKSSLNILDLSTKRSKKIFDGEIKKWAFLDEGVVVLASNKVQVLSINGDKEKEYQTNVDELTDIQNFYIFENELFLESNDSLYIVGLKE